MRPYTVRYDEVSRVVRCSWAPGSSCGLADARATTDEVASLAADLGGRPLPLLVDMTGMAGIAREAREHFATSASGVSAIALLTGSAVSRMIANFFIGLRKSQVPMRMFRTEAEAVEWLTSFR